MPIIDKLDFDERAHVYRYEHVIVPGVTSAIGLFAKNFAGIPAGVFERACQRGTAVHLATEYDDKGTLDESVLDPSLHGYIEAYRRFKAETGFKPDQDKTELKVYHPRHKYAGTLDRIGDYRDIEIVLDIKTGSAMRPTTGPQTAAYEAAYRAMQEHHGDPMPRYGVELHKDGTYFFKRFDDPGDLAVFLASLTLLRWRMKNDQ